MSELIQIVFYNLLILLILLVCGYVFIKWKLKKRNDAILNEISQTPEVMKYFDRKGAERLKKVMEAHDKKHPLKALKRKLKEKLNWLF